MYLHFITNHFPYSLHAVSLTEFHSVYIYFSLSKFHTMYILFVTNRNPYNIYTLYNYPNSTHCTYSLSLNKFHTVYIYFIANKIPYRLHTVSLTEFHTVYMHFITNQVPTNQISTHFTYSLSPTKCPLT